MRNIAIIIIGLSYTLAGCTPKPFLPFPQAGSSYQLGTTYTINTGFPMIVVYNACSYPAYKPRYKYQPPPIVYPFSYGVRSYLARKGIAEGTTKDSPPITPNQIWFARYTYGHNYLVCSPPNYHPEICIEINPNGELADKHPWIRENREKEDPVWELMRKLLLWEFILRLFHSDSKQARGDSPFWNLPDSASQLVKKDYILELPDPKLFEETAAGSFIPVHSGRGSFKAELIYTGRVGEVITISYREYVDDMARPAFYQELKYDLGRENEIIFKSLRVKVIEATNKNITFQVIDDGGLPWVPLVRCQEGIRNE